MLAKLHKNLAPIKIMHAKLHKNLATHVCGNDTSISHDISLGLIISNGANIVVHQVKPRLGTVVFPHQSTAQGPDESASDLIPC